MFIKYWNYHSFLDIVKLDLQKYLDHNVQNIVHDNNDAEKVLVSNQHTIKSIQNHHVLDESSSDSDDNDICSSSVPNKLHSFSPSNSVSLILKLYPLFTTQNNMFHYQQYISDSIQ